MTWLLRFLALLCLAVSAAAQAGGRDRRLTKDDVGVLIMNTPAVLALECRQGCPILDMTSEGRHLMSVQIRNGCPKSGSGMIDNYTVDLRTGEVWTGIDERTIIDSPRLRIIRRILFRTRSSQ